MSAPTSLPERSLATALTASPPGKRTISISEINLYLLCGLKYQFTYVDRLEKPFKPAGLALGAAVHSAIEWFHRERLLRPKQGKTPPTIDEALRIFRADWFAQACEPIAFKEGENAKALAALGEALVRLYLESSAETNVVEVERRFEVPLVDPVTGQELSVRLVGYMDMIEVAPDDDGRETVVELKTAARRYDEETIARNLQVTAYSYASTMLNGQSPRLRLDVLLKQRTPRLERHETTRSEDDVKWFLALAKEAVAAIEVGAFVPHPGWLCSDCEYRPACDKWRGK